MPCLVGSTGWAAWFYILLFIQLFLVLLLFFAEKIFVVKPDVIANSIVYKYVSPWGPKVIDNLGKIIPFFKDMFLQLENFFESMAQKSV